MKKKASAHLHLRLPADLKRKAEKIIEQSGLDTSTAIRLYFTQIAAQGTIPLTFKTINGFTPEFEAELVRLATDKKNIVGPFETTKALLASLYGDED
jgi:addiction module RelB/DinJ family antitoxin